MALEADVLANGGCLLTSIALVTQSSACVLDETQVRERHVANLAVEAERMPVVIHRLDHSSDDELAALATARGVQDVEVMFTVLSTLEFVEDGIFSKGLEALSTHEAALVPDLSSCRVALVNVKERPACVPELTICSFSSNPSPQREQNIVEVAAMTGQGIPGADGERAMDRTAKGVSE